ncbi:ferredoxin [Streptomyces sp. NBC_01264]|uniref:ferredoxin n=1 Tax=Streptomyces sp. NBC_01264 TaxID=2903804 RepID=UPI0022540AC0|nr:ferredoxin [Streptomyces sp. NBC_01264]MCX4777871.1 ferredoxin [Streptomyces sp. NBC_01264]
MTYWDPIPTLRAMPGEPLPLWRGALVDRDWSLPAPDGWEQRDWRSVPGPLYAANTDTCLTGRQCAPDLVMYEDEYGSEFLYRQPRTQEEVHRFICAADCEPFGGYGGDGDLHWTPELVRDWWRERGRVREWAMVQGWGAGEEAAWALGGNDAGARAYVAHIDRDLADYLRGYLFRLQEGRAPRPGETLPGL